jgi:3-oxoadipate enol-lactonase
LDALGVERALLCGYSLGGSVALEFARHYPHRTAGIALQATALAYPHMVDRMLVSGLRCARPFARLGLGRTAALRYFASLRTASAETGELWPWLRRELAQAHPAELVQAGIADLQFDFRPHVGLVRELPISVLVTAADREVPPEDQLAMAVALDAVVVELDSDHDVFLADPGRYAEAAVAQIGRLARAEV